MRNWADGRGERFKRRWAVNRLMLMELRRRRDEWSSRFCAEYFAMPAPLN